MTPERREQLAIIMSYLHYHGFAKTEIKDSVDAWWKVKADESKS